MSKPRSRLVGKADHEFRTVRGLTTVIHFGKQAKHLPGQKNFDPTKSEITVAIDTLQHLVELYAGTGRWHEGSTKESVDFKVAIGIHRNLRTGAARITTRGTIHYSKTGAHVVPAEPKEMGRSVR